MPPKGGTLCIVCVQQLIRRCLSRENSRFRAYFGFRSVQYLNSLFEKRPVNLRASIETVGA